MTQPAKPPPAAGKTAPPAAVSVRLLELETPHGPARAHIHTVAQPRATLVLGHGAGGGVGAPDLLAATAAALACDLTVVLVEQPYRVAGRRSPAPAAQLDRAWAAALAGLRADQLPPGLAAVTGGRSMGARVACRTAATVGAAGVLCLAFPLIPPRRSAAKPAVSRLPELDAVTVPTLVVQGRRDPFGLPPQRTGRTVIGVNGDHSLRSDLAAVGAAVSRWLTGLDLG